MSVAILGQLHLAGDNEYITAQPDLLYTWAGLWLYLSFLHQSYQKNANLSNKPASDFDYVQNVQILSCLLVSYRKQMK
jgi:hypothetical protein